MASPSAASPNGNALAFMQKLSPEVLLYRPAEDSSSSSTTTTDHNNPKLILLASWTDASDSHIAKYVAKYQELFPRSSIALIKNSTGLFFRPATIVPVVQRVVPVIKSIFDTGLFPPSRPELLIHLFSNGGSSSIATLLETYAASPTGDGQIEGEGDGEAARMPLHVTIFDSAPSEFAPARLVSFVQVGMSPVVRLLTAPLAWLAGYGFQFLVAVGLMRDWFSVWGNAHNNQAINHERRRLYIYSKSDKLVDWRTVVAHAAQATERGFEVQTDEFVGSAHVAHARKDEERYWGLVRNLWSGN